MFWRLATLPLLVPSPLVGLTSVFGMRTGVAPPISHQNIKLKVAKLFAFSPKRQDEKINWLSNFLIEWKISTPRLNALLHLHLAPINVIISHDSHNDS